MQLKSVRGWLESIWPKISACMQRYIIGRAANEWHTTIATEPCVRECVCSSEFSASSYFLVNKHKYFPIWVDIGGNKPSALIPSRFSHTQTSLLLQIGVFVNIRTYKSHLRKYLSLWKKRRRKKHSNAKRIREPAVNSLHSTHDNKNSKNMFSQKKECLSIGVYFMCCVQCKQSLSLCKHAVYTFHMMFIAFDFSLLTFFTFVEPHHRKKETICLAWCVLIGVQAVAMLQGGSGAVAVIANIDAINTEARGGTNTNKHHSKSWKCNDCNNICDTNVKSFWIFTLRFSFRVFLRFPPWYAKRKMPNRKSEHKKVKFIAMKKGTRKRERANWRGSTKNKLEERNLHYWNVPPTI